MDRLYYCNECKRVIRNEESCSYCKAQDVRELVLKTPVNIIGTKTKGNVFKIKDDRVTLIVKDQSNNRFLKEYSFEQLRKVL